MFYSQFDSFKSENLGYYSKQKLSLTKWKLDEN